MNKSGGNAADVPEREVAGIGCRLGVGEASDAGDGTLPAEAWNGERGGEGVVELHAERRGMAANC